MTDCSKIPTLNLVESSKKGMEDVVNFAGSREDEYVSELDGSQRLTIEGVSNKALEVAASKAEFITPSIPYGSGELVLPDDVDVPNEKYPANQAVYYLDPVANVTIAYRLAFDSLLPYDLSQPFNHEDWIPVSLTRKIQRNFPAYSDYQKIFPIVEADGTTPIRFIDAQPYYDGRKLTGQKDSGPGSLPPSFTIQRPSPNAPDEIVIDGITIYSHKEFWVELTIEEPITAENDMLNFGEVVYVRDYTRAGDVNSASGIAQAFEAAKNKQLIFEPNGVYNIDGLCGEITCENIRVDFNNSTFNITGLTKAQHDIEGDSARGWWYRSDMIRINAQNVVLLNGVFDGQNSFIDTIVHVQGGRLFTNNLEFNNVRYPNDTFSSQWPDNTEGALTVEDCTKSDIENVSFSKYFYRLFDGSLTNPNSNAELQGRCLSLNGRNGTECTQMYVSGVHFNECSMATVSDQTNEVTYNACTWRSVRANCAYLLSGGISANFFGGFMTDCDDQGISCYATNLKVIGMSFFNVANRPIALRDTALDRLVVQGCTFKHVEAGNYPAMMPIGFPSGDYTSIKNVVISNNAFDIDVLDYYIAQIGNVIGMANLCDNIIRIGRCVSGVSNFIFWYESTEDSKPNISGNRIHYEGNDEVSLCRTTQPVALGRNVITPVAKQDGSSPSVKTPDSTYEVTNGNLNSIVGSNANTTPKGNFHVSCQTEMSESIKNNFGVTWSASVDSSNFSAYEPYTMGAFGLFYGNNLNQDLSDNYFGIIMPHPTTRVLRRVGRVNSDGDFVAEIAGAGFIATTPDGSKQYRISVDNSGNVISNLI